MNTLMRPILAKFTGNLRASTFTLTLGVNDEEVSGGGNMQREKKSRNYSTAVDKELRMCKQFLGKPVEKYKTCTHVIFDLDGTLLNTEDMNYEASAQYLNRVFKKKLTFELYGQIMGSSSVDGANTIVKELSLPISTDIYLHGVWQSLRETLQTSQEMPGVDYLVCHFERCQVPMGLATSSTKQTYDIKAKHHKKLFSKFCPIVLGGSDPKVARGKPNPDIFLVAASRFPDQPEKAEQVLVIEDSLNGVRAAKAAGMQVLMVPNHNLPRHLIELAEPTLLLNSLQQFNPKIFNLPGFPGTQKPET